MILQDFFHGKAAGSILDLSPGLSNWNLSLQNGSMQGLAGYCTQGTGCSSKGPLAFIDDRLNDSSPPIFSYR